MFPLLEPGLGSAAQGSGVTVCVFTSRHRPRNAGADAGVRPAERHLSPGGDGGHEVHHLHGGGAGAEGQSGSGWRGRLHHRWSVGLRRPLELGLYLTVEEKVKFPFVWFSRSAGFSGNSLVRSQDRSGILQPVYAHERQVGSSPSQEGAWPSQKL